MRINKHKEDCCGCSACAQICPQKAISLVPDVLGFKYPMIDDKLCIDCGLCVKVCQFKTDYQTFEVRDPEIYAFRNKDEDQLLRSQSGAAFWTLAKSIIKEGGVVYGVGFADNFRVVHKRVTTLEALEELRGSKYVQSDVCNTFLETKNDLKQGLKVLYSGTSCQIAGLKAYVGKNLRKNLYSIDLVCHGVPSPKIWEEYLKVNPFIIKYNNQDVICIKFRDKEKGWSSSVTSFSTKNNKYFSTSYSNIFYSGLALRESCFLCPYTNFNRVSDVTVADFWGWDKVSDLFQDNKGVSLLMVNSDKGQYLLDMVRDEIYLISSDRKSCMQHNLSAPSVRNHLRSEFEADYALYGYDYVTKKYFSKSFFKRVKNKLKRILKLI